MVHVDSRELIHEKMDPGYQQALDEQDQADRFNIRLKRYLTSSSSSLLSLQVLEGPCALS